MGKPADKRRRQYLVAAGIVGLVAASLGWMPVAIAAEETAELSLKQVPANVAFYTSMLRNREQIEAIAKSKAWAKLMGMPAVQELLKHVHAQLDTPQAAPVKQFFQAPENKQLLELLADLASNEIYVYGGDTFLTTADLVGQVAGGMRFQPLMLQLSGQDPTKAQVQALLNALSEHLDLVKMPDLVFGFRCSNKDRAETQLKRLEEFLKGLAQQAPPLKDRVKRVQVGDASFLTLGLDGSLVPWDRIPFDDYESKAGQFDALTKKLKELKLTISVGVRGNYVLLGLGESSEHLKPPSGDQTLADRPELKPLHQFADKRICSIGYVSKALYSRLASSKKDVDAWMEAANGFLQKAPLPGEVTKRIKRDLADLAKDLKGLIPEVGAVMGFAFLTETGQESYSYNWGEHSSVDTSKPLTLLHHLGGDPLAAAVGRSKYSPEKYQLLVKWIKVANGYFEQFALPLMPEERKEQYEKIAKIAHPLLRRFDDVTGKMLLPALADGQMGLVIDAKVKSTQWFPGMPATDKPMPMLELALVLGVKDAALLKKAMTEYRSIVNDAITGARELVPILPAIQIPDPETKEVKGGTLYYYPLPPLPGLDAQVSPNAGLSDHVAVLSFFMQHSERLLADKPLETKDGPLADAKRPLAGAAYLNFAGLVEAASPWVDFGAKKLGPKLLNRGNDDADGKDDGGDAKKSLGDILPQVHTVLDILKVLRTYTSCTYVENGALVTHGQIVFQDL
jgi:hypothetical protein